MRFESYTIKKHFEKHIPVAGQKLILLYTGYAMPGEVTYTLVKVEFVLIKPRVKEIIINAIPLHGKSVFHFSGKNTFSPKGQSLLLPYNKALGEHIKKKGRPVHKDQEYPLELQINIEEINNVLGNQDSPVAD